MATYQDIHRIIKETIQVDADPTKRWTPQLVKFINHENEFYGKFYGSVNASEFFASDCSLSNVSLLNCKLYDLSGNEIDLNSIFPAISSMNDRFDRISSMVYIELPNRIDNVHTYVNTVSSGISVLIDEKIAESGKQGSKDLSSVSAFLQGEIEQEWKDRYDNDKALSDDIADIRSKIKGGIIYRGIVHTDGSKVDSNISSLIETGEPTENEVRHGYMYVVNGPKRSFELSTTVNYGDYIFINISKSESGVKKICEITEKDIDVLDAMNGDVYCLISKLSGDVVGLKTISAEHELSIITERNNRISNDKKLGEKITTVSSEVEKIPSLIDSKISEKVQTLSTETVSADNKFIYSVREENGKIYAETRGIVDSDIEVDGISQNKIIDLTSDLFNISSELSTIDRRNRGDVSWMGDFTNYDSNTLSDFMHSNTGKRHDQYLRKGFLYRFRQEHVLSDKTSQVKKFLDNEYLLIDNDVVISDATFDSFRYIGDCRDQISSIIEKVQQNESNISSLSNEIDGMSCDMLIDDGGYILSSLTQSRGKITSYGTTKLLSSHVNGLSDYVKSETQKCVQLSGGNSISGYNVFTGDLSVTYLSSSFKNFFDCRISEILSVLIPDLEDPRVLEIVERINEIIDESGIDVKKIEEFQKTVCKDIKNKTVEIFSVAYPEEVIPEVETFSDIKNILNGVLRVLKCKETGDSLDTKLKKLKESINRTQQYVDILNDDLISLCTHVNISCQEFRDDIDKMCSDINALSTDYHTLKSTTFHEFDESKGIESMGLVVEDQSYNTITGKHDKYVMTFLSGTIVYEKI